MTVDEFAKVLRGDLTLVEDGFYEGNRTGYWARFESKGLRYWYSVSNTSERIAAQLVAEAITAPDRHIQRSKPYHDGEGFEATVRSGRHHYMLGHGNNRARILNRAGRT